ncbi:glycosyltransferase [Ferrimicrobium sp.]|uniref:glycosyltransferase family 4 protein n=1 Tax=Ferrimicrobium sp. TaxID=2926050 RepID=UPI0026276063|nr:glycosyltransferase [Ferrimicrobium sp.]
MSAIFQLIPSFATYDAIGTHTRRLDTLLRELGYETAIYADDFDEAVSGCATPFAELRHRPPKGVWYLYQASTNSRIADWLRDRPRVLINYHNVTPHALAKPFEPEIARVLWQARREIGGLAQTTQRAFTVSHYNAVDLFELGFLHPLIAPPLLELPQQGRKPAPEIDSTHSHWLFVGRIFPNKHQLFLIEAFALYHQLFDRDATLTLVGSTASRSYLAAIKESIALHRLCDSVRLLSGLDPSALTEEYRRASLFTSASLHEGFGFPFIEAFAHQTPVLALATSAVSETVGSAGWLLQQEDPLSFALAAHTLHNDAMVRARLIERGLTRLRAFDPEPQQHRYQRLIEQLVGTP